MAEDRNTSRTLIINTSGGRGSNNTWQSAGVWTSDRHTDVLTDTLIPNKFQNEHELLCKPSCNTSLAIIDTTLIDDSLESLRVAC